jgi:flagellin-like protein
MVYRIAPRYRKALEPLIAAIILIAITLVIAIAVVAWILGVFGTSVGGREELLVLPNATLINSTSSWILSLTVRNTGSVTAQVIGVSVANYSCTGGILPVNVGPGQTVAIQNLQCGQSTSFQPGVTYTIKVITAAGNTYFSQVVAST